MQDPEPPKSFRNWVPSQSIVAGVGVGQAVAQIVFAICTQGLHWAVDGLTHDAIISLCTFAACYFIPDGKSRS